MFRVAAYVKNNSRCVGCSFFSEVCCFTATENEDGRHCSIPLHANCSVKEIQQSVFLENCPCGCIWQQRTLRATAGVTAAILWPRQDYVFLKTEILCKIVHRLSGAALFKSFRHSVSYAVCIFNWTTETVRAAHALTTNIGGSAPKTISTLKTNINLN